LAIAKFARSIILTSQERLDDAETLLLDARAVFAEADLRRFDDTFWQQAVIYDRRGDTNRAAETFAVLAERTSARGDDENTAALYRNIAFCCARAGRYWMALQYTERAIALARLTRNRRAEFQNLWNKAATLAAAGHLDEALPVYEEARSGYVEMNAGSDLVRLEVEIAERLLESDPRADLYERFCALAALATRMGIPITLAHVTQRLREMAARRAINADVLRYTSAFVSDLAMYPDLVFTPPGGGDDTVRVGN
jgi:tetratricopeptide (TPR) repeat protein